MVGLMGEQLLGWVHVTSGAQHRLCRNHPWGGATVGVWLAEVMCEVAGPASMPSCDVLGPGQQAKSPLTRRAHVEC